MKSPFKKRSASGRSSRPPLFPDREESRRNRVSTEERLKKIKELSPGVIARALRIWLSGE